MGFSQQTRSRESREGWLGRRRTYQCRVCNNKYKVDTLNPLPEKERICPYCNATFPYTFTDKYTGQDIEIRAYSAEHATLKAWGINSNLAFKDPQPIKGK